MNSQSSSAGSGSVFRIDVPPMVEEKALNMIASSTIPAIGLWRSPGRDATGRLGVLEHLAEERDQRVKGKGGLGRMAGQQLLGKVHHDPRRRQRHRWCPGQRRTAQPVVLDHEPMDALERIALVVDLLAQVLRRRADGLLEQGEQQLVLAAEVLIEEPEGLAGAFDDFVHGEVTAGFPLVHQFEGGIQKSLEAVLGPGPGGEE